MAGVLYGPVVSQGLQRPSFNGSSGISREVEDRSGVEGDLLPLQVTDEVGQGRRLPRTSCQGVSTRAGAWGKGDAGQLTSL